MRASRRPRSLALYTRGERASKRLSLQAARAQVVVSIYIGERKLARYSDFRVVFCGIQVKFVERESRGKRLIGSV